MLISFVMSFSQWKLIMILILALGVAGQKQQEVCGGGRWLQEEVPCMGTVEAWVTYEQFQF